MLNIALALTFLISSLAAPGFRLLSILFGQEALPIPPYQTALFIAFANYWLPATLIYLLLRGTRANRFLAPDISAQTVLLIANVVIALYIGIRVLASTVEGGALSFAWITLAAYPVKISQWALAVGIGWLVVRSAWNGFKGVSYSDKDPRPLFRTTSGIVALAMLLPPLAFFGWTFATNANVIYKAAIARNARESRFEELCRDVRIDIRKTVKDVKSVYFSEISELAAILRKKMEYVEVMNINHVIVRTAQRNSPLSTPPPGQYAEFSREEITEATAQYQIATKSLTEKRDQEAGLGVVQFTITDRRTGDVLAVFSEVMEIRGGSLVNRCPKEFADFRYDLVGYVLGLHDPSKAREIADKVAIFHSANSK